MARAKRVSLGQQQRKSMRAWVNQVPKPPTRQWHKTVKETRRAARKVIRKEAGIETGIAVSPRHRAFLTRPGMPFAHKRTEEHGVRSTAVVGYTYYPERRMLVLHWWKNWKKQIPGDRYAYFDVPQWKYERLLRASSKGRYIYYNIRTTHTFRRL